MNIIRLSWTGKIKTAAHLLCVRKIQRSMNTKFYGGMHRHSRNKIFITKVWAYKKHHTVICAHNERIYNLGIHEAHPDKYAHNICLTVSCYVFWLVNVNHILQDCFTTAMCFGVDFLPPQDPRDWRPICTIWPTKATRNNICLQHVQRSTGWWPLPQWHCNYIEQL